MNAMNYAVVIEPRALDEIQEAIDYYNLISPRLGEKFYAELDSYFETLARSPKFQVRYKDIRCVPLKTFPYMIHFRIDEIEMEVLIEAIINCNRNPETNWLVNEP